MFGIKKLHKALNFIIIASIAAASIASTAYAGTIDNMDYIVHAGGQAGDDIGTNSLEAINNSFLYGYRYIEIDFNFTSDGKLVCVHDWDTDYFRMGKPAGKVLSSEEFDNAKVLAKYTTMTAEELAQWLYQKPNTYVITDIKENNIAGLQYLAYNCGYIKDRIIPQIYNESEYDKVKAMGYNNIIYTLYKLNYSDKTNTSEIVRFAQSHKLYAIVFSTELAKSNYVNALKRAGTKLMVHTVNSVSEAERMYNMGIDGISSDYLRENLK